MILSYEYIRGLVEGEGCFTFCSIGWRGESKKKIPAFVISMSVRDKDLLASVKETLGLRNIVYEYGPRRKSDGYDRSGMATIIVRDLGQLKNIIVPLFYKKLAGNKGKQFEDWISRIGDDPDVPSPYKLITRMHKFGFYDKNPKFSS